MQYFTFIGWEGNLAVFRRSTLWERFVKYWLNPLSYFYKNKYSILRYTDDGYPIGLEGRKDLKLKLIKTYPYNRALQSAQKVRQNGKQPDN